MNKFIKFLLSVVAATALGTTPVQADVESVTQQARQLIDAGRAQEALSTLQPVLVQYAGNVQFDYALALALMESGDNPQAELVLERLLGSSPTFHGARLDYARVLVARQKYPLALTQLDIVSASQPPQRAQVEVNKLRAVIDHRSRRSRWSRYLEGAVAAGYDSNVNSATVVDEFLGFDLDATSQEQDSDFLDVGVAGGIGYQMSRNMKLSGRLSYRKRENAQASFVDSDALSADIRWVRTSDTDYQQVKLTAYQFDIDGSRNSDGVALSGSWLRTITPQWRIGIMAEAGQIDFSNNLDVKDVTRYKAGFIGVYSMGENAEGQLLFRAGAGTDEPRLSESRYARDFLYAGASASWQFNSTIRSSVSVDYQSSQFDEVFFEQLYTQKREDDRYRIVGAVDWTFRPSWTLSHTLSYTRNDTFVDIFEYERFEALLRLRYKFQ